MTVTNVDANSTKNLGQLLVQQILAQGSGTTSSTSGSGAGGAGGAQGDQLTLSPAAQALSQVPASVTSAMQDLLSAKSNVPADSTALKAYLKTNPQGMPALMASLNASSGTYSASGTVSGSSILQQLLASGSSSGNSNGNGAVGALLNLFSGSNSSSSGDTLLQLLSGSTGTSASASASSSVLQSLLGNMNQDPLLASLNGSSDSSNSNSLLG